VSGSGLESAANRDLPRAMQRAVRRGVGEQSTALICVMAAAFSIALAGADFLAKRPAVAYLNPVPKFLTPRPNRFAAFLLEKWKVESLFPP
jgi:hypothetical protein